MALYDSEISKKLPFYSFSVVTKRLFKDSPQWFLNKYMYVM